jgi:hypothetical protein
MKKIITIIILFFGVNIAGAQMYWNQAGSFAGGSNSYIAFPNAAGINITGNFTLECWVYPLSTGGNRYLIFKKDGSSASYYTGINSSNKFFVGTSPGITRLVSNASIPLNKWTHVAAIYDGEFHIYINGSEDVSSGAANFPPQSSSDSLLIGRGSVNTGFHGLIDEVRIWNQARTGAGTLGRTFRSTLYAYNGDYDNLKFSLPFQRSRYTPGNEFEIKNVITGGIGNNIGVTARSFTNQPSEYLSLNTALLMNSASNSVWVNNGANINLTDAFTIEAWVTQTETDGIRPIVHKNPSNTGYKLVLNNGEIVYTINGVNIFTGVTISEQNWHHIAWTRSSGGVSKIYVDGALRHTEASTPPPVSNSDSLRIGKEQANYFWGSIDELRIAKIEKTHEQIQRFMYCSIDEYNQPAGTNVCWNFDGVPASSTGNGTLNFGGSTSFTATIVVNSIGASHAPVVRNNDGGFPNGYRFKNSFEDLGSNFTDSLAVNETGSISDINLFLTFSASNAYLTSLRITLIAPNNDSTVAMANFLYRDSMVYRTNVILDEQADSLLTPNKYVFLGSRMKPVGTFSGFTGDNPNGVWRIRVRRTSGFGSGGELVAWGLQINNSTMVGVETVSNEAPANYILEQNYPNPFNPSTNVKFAVPVRGYISLRVFDVLGKEVAVLVNKEMNAGSYNVDFDGSRLPSGVYFYKLETEAFTDVKKMLLVK